jgi:hypothetical protein
MTPSEARDQIEKARSLLREVEDGLDARYAEVRFELTEAGETVDRAVDQLDEILLGVN